MKFIIVFTCVVAFVYGDYQLSKEFEAKSMEKILEVVEKCQEQEHVSDADLAELKQQKSPSTREGKCMIACANEEFGALGKDGKFSKDGIVKSLEPFIKENEELYNDLYKLIVDVCLPQITAADRCDAAVEMAGCYVKNASDDIKKIHPW